MAKKSPYERNLAPGAIPIKYIGIDAGYYCFEVCLSHRSGLDAIMFSAEITNWIMSDAQGKSFFGNGFGKGYPPFKFDGTKSNNMMLAIERRIDVYDFSRKFVLNGAEEILK